LQALIVLETKNAKDEEVWLSLSRVPGVDGALFLDKGTVIVRTSFADIEDLNQAVRSIRSFGFVKSTRTRIVLKRLEGEATQL